MNKLIVLILSISLSACSAIPIMPQAASVELVNEKPNDTCKFIAEIAGSQGNWFTGDWTTNEDLVIGARNEIRNKAYRLGGNLVHVQDMKNTNAWGSAGTSNTTVIGKVYKC